jgi:hypothetical protein
LIGTPIEKWDAGGLMKSMLIGAGLGAFAATPIGGISLGVIGITQSTYTIFNPGATPRQKLVALVWGLFSAYAMRTGVTQLK